MKNDISAASQFLFSLIGHAADTIESINEANKLEAPLSSELLPETKEEAAPVVVHTTGEVELTSEIEEGSTWVSSYDETTNAVTLTQILDEDTAEETGERTGIVHVMSPSHYEKVIEVLPID